MTNLPAETRIPAWTQGERLMKARRDAGLTQNQLAEMISVSRRQIIDYENDKKRPSRGHLLLWQMMTRVPAEWLETGQEPRPGDGGPSGGSMGAPDDGAPSRARTGDLRFTLSSLRRRALAA